MNTRVILCPIDFSDGSSAAFQLVCSLASPRNSKVILLHVTGAGEQPLTMQDAWTQRTESGIRDQILTDNSVTVEHITKAGDPAEVIAQIAKAKKVDLIVMGTHGRTGLDRVVMGSVAQAVLRKVACAVVTVRPEQTSDKL